MAIRRHLDSGVNHDALGPFNRREPLEIESRARVRSPRTPLGKEAAKLVIRYARNSYISVQRTLLFLSVLREKERSLEGRLNARRHRASVIHARSSSNDNGKDKYGSVHLLFTRCFVRAVNL